MHAPVTTLEHWKWPLLILFLFASFFFLSFLSLFLSFLSLFLSLAMFPELQSGPTNSQMFSPFGFPGQMSSNAGVHASVSSASFLQPTNTVSFSGYAPLSQQSGGLGPVGGMYSTPPMLSHVVGYAPGPTGAVGFPTVLPSTGYTFANGYPYSADFVNKFSPQSEDDNRSHDDRYQGEQEWGR